MSERRFCVLIACGSALLLTALASLTFQRHSYASIDTAIKMIQSTELARSGGRSMALSYPARDLDPTERFLPFEKPFVFLSAGKWQSIFSSFYAVAVSPLVSRGVEWLVALAILGVVVAVTATSSLAGAHPIAGPVVLLATPVWLYGLNPNETPLALGCAIAAMAVATRVGGSRGDWIAGLLLGVGSLLRDETLLLTPGLLYARHLRGTPVRQLLRLLVGVGLPVLVMSALDHWWLERPMLAHLRHAVPGFDGLLPRSRARLPELAVMGWHKRVVTVVEYWLLGFGGLAAGAALAGCIGLTHLRTRLSPLLVATLMVVIAVVHVVDVVGLLHGPRVMAGLFRLAPFLLLALLPRAHGEPPPPLVRLVWVTTGCYLAVALATLNTEGGKSTGPRLIIGLWPLLAAGAIETLSSYIAAARQSWTARVTALAGLVLVIGSLVMQMGVILPAWASRIGADAEAARLVRAVGDEVIVMNTMFDIELVGSLHFERKLMLPRWHQYKELSATLAERGVQRFTSIARTPGTTTDFPDYRRAEVWEPGRFIVSRWVREASAAP